MNEAGTDMDKMMLILHKLIDHTQGRQSYVAHDGGYRWIPCHCGYCWYRD